MKKTLKICLFATLILLGFSSISAQNSTRMSNDVASLITKKREFNKEYGFGFRIQIYYGDETKARSLQQKFKLNYPNVFTKLEYDRPYWKVKVGNYKSKLEADRATLIFSEKFSGLIVVPLGK